MILLLFILLFASGECLNKYLKHFEPLNYSLLSMNRVSRSAQDPITLNFHAYSRDFKVILDRIPEKESALMTNFTVEFANESISFDWESDIYKGRIEGENKSRIIGSIHDGIFEGMIRISNVEEYWIESSIRYNSSAPFHSFIYSKNEVEMPKAETRMKRSREELPRLPYQYCEADVQGMEIRKAYNKSRKGRNKKKNRKHLTPHVDNTGIWSPRLCTLLIEVDHILYNWALDREGKKEKDHFKTQNWLISTFTSLVKHVNEIYMPIDFNGIRGIEFKIASFKFWKDENEHGNSFDSTITSAFDFLEKIAKQKHSKYCLAYVFTFRDFDKDIQGLTYPCYICTAANTIHQHSHNTGIVTFKVQGTEIPRSTWHLTLAHEFGHNLGSNHDDSLLSTGITETETHPECKDNGEGFFLMHASASDGKKPNNNLFSPCSIRNISRNLARIMKIDPALPDARQTNCFIESNTPICGDGFVEDGEECDCGYDEAQCERGGDKQCCGPANSDGFACKLLKGKICAPSQGECCSESCQLKTSGEICIEATDCSLPSQCTGSSVVCPHPAPTNESQPCNNVEGSCKNGECNGSVCAVEGMEECPSSDRTCLQHCLSGGECKSTAALPQFSHNKYRQDGRWGHSGIMKKQGEYCMGSLGRCDSSDECRDVVTNSEVVESHAEGFHTFGETLANNYWILILIAILFIAILGVTIKFCYFKKPESSESDKPKGVFSRIQIMKSKRKGTKNVVSNTSQGSQEAPYTSQVKASEVESNGQ